MPREKKSLSQLRHLLARQTQTRTHVLFPRSWQNGSQATQWQRELSFRCQAYKLSYPESSALMKTVVLEWKSEQEGFLPWELSKLARVTQKDGDIHLVPMVSTCPSHKTTLSTERILRWQWRLWREVSQRHRALGKIKGLHQQRLKAVASSLQVPSRSARSLDLSVSTCKGCKKASGNVLANDV